MFAFYFSEVNYFSFTINISIIFSILFLAFPLLLKADDNFHVPYAPKGIKFNSIEPLRSSDAANALSGMLAFTVNTVRLTTRVGF